MHLPLDYLSRCFGMSRHQSVGWGSSLAAHAVGALVVWGTCAAFAPTERPELRGGPAAETIELECSWVEPEEPAPSIEIVPLEAEVLVSPDWVRIGEQTFVPRSTDVSQPTPAELAMVDHWMSSPSPLVERRPLGDASEESARAAVPPPSRVSRRPKSAEMPRGKVAVSPPAAHRAAAQRASATAGEVTLPRRLDNHPPEYPKQALPNRLEGVVLLRVYVTAEGRVEKLEIISSSGYPLFDAEAVRAVRTWRYSPAVRAGRPVPFTFRQPVRFAPRSS